MKPDISIPRKRRMTRKPRPGPKQDGVCLFHNDGECLYAFPDTWQAAFDFLKSKDGFVVHSQESGQCANSAVWGKRFRESVGFTYKGCKNKIATLSIGNGRWGLNNLRIEPNSSLRIAYEGEQVRAYRF